METKFNNEQHWAEIEALEPLSVSMFGLAKAIESAREYEEQARLYSESKVEQREGSQKWEKLATLEARARQRGQIVLRTLNLLFPDREYEELPSRPLDEHFDYH